jgi:ArsR family transcriptional regulator, arsenate/arsenite/antimonite-responsive transcriptional repressor
MKKPFDIFKALGEENRFRVTALLVRAGHELCACEIVDALEKPQYTISKSMNLLIDVGIVHERRVGKEMVYHLRPESDEVTELIQLLSRLISKGTYPWKDDFRRLDARLRLRNAKKSKKQE